MARIEWEYRIYEMWAIHYGLERLHLARRLEPGVDGHQDRADEEQNDSTDEDRSQ